MLVMLYGTSCSGKSEIIHNLIALKGYIPINCYTTRESRPNDLARISITHEEFISMENTNSFGVVNKHLSSFYGNLRKDLENAISDTKNIYILDFLIKDYHKLTDYNHIKIIVLPEDESQLRLQIQNGNRRDRENEILNDYVENYNLDKIEEYKKKGFKIIINKFNHISQTVNEIDLIVNQWEF